MGKYFGTDGFRGEANVNLTVDHAFKIGKFLGWYFGREHKAQIVIGKDTRRSSYMFECALSAGITAAGGDAYLAHLHLTKKPADELDRFVKHLAEAGLTGIEGYYTDYTADHEREYRALAKKYGLKISGGTDFHGSFKPHITIGRGLGEMEIPYSVLEEMKKR